MKAHFLLFLFLSSQAFGAGEARFPKGIIGDVTGNLTGNVTGNLTGNVTGNASGTAANVTGVVAAANGGSGVASPSANAVLLGNGASAFQTVAPSTSGNVLTSNGTTWASAAPGAVSYVAPTVQTFTSGSGTYTTPTSPRTPVYIRVRMVGGGGGGGGGGTIATATSGSPGVASTFQVTAGPALLSAGGGAGGTAGIATGGTASLGSGPVGLALPGGYGGGFVANDAVTMYLTGGAGASSPFFGAGVGQANGAGAAAVANSGSGGAGGGSASVSGCYGIGGGAAGGYVDAVITSPSATYSYVVGDGGAAGGAGTSGYAGGAGGRGRIIVEEFYQ